MKKLNQNTKQARHFINAYNHPEAIDLDGVYAKPSAAKKAAYKKCVEAKNDLQGYGGRIMGHNSYGFTYGFKEIGKEYEAILHVITKESHYVIVLG